MSLYSSFAKFFQKKKILNSTEFSNNILHMATWSLPVPNVLENLKTKPIGLSYDDVIERQKIFGKNQFRKKGGPSKIAIFIDQFKSPLIFLLIGAAILASILGEWLNTIVITLAVLVNTFLGFYQEYHAEQTLQKLTLYIRERVRVVRNGVPEEIDSIDLVPGDIIDLTFGSRVPADARLLSINSLAIDESILTGESLPVRKSIEEISEGSQVAERTNMVFAGTLVNEGYGRAVVCHIAQDTELGRIAELVASTEHAKTPLQLALQRFGWLVFAGVIILVLVIFILGVSRGQPLGEMLILSAAIAVGAIPEALPISMTVILAVGAERLASKKGIMRSLSAAETLGSATLIMTDKTGTLTEAKMKLVAIVPAEDILFGKEINLLEDRNILDIEKKILTMAITNIDVVKEKSVDANKTVDFLGRPMEVNIARAGHKYNISIDVSTREILLPFSSKYKFSVGHDFASNTVIALGAPDVLLSRSDISKEDYLVLEKAIHDIGAEGKRVLGVVELPHNIKNIMGQRSVAPEDVAGVKFLGLIVLYDPIRSEVPEAIARIENSGARVVMVTGDMKGTARAIARDLGWDVGEGSVLSGNELHELTDEQLLVNLKNIKIFARVTPEDKLRIGMLYKKMGEIVAMTGDGVNDAPSLNAVDIGIALGSGSDVAKSAADLVLLDDNFKTIVLAIEEGRRILSNIRKTFVYLMSSALDGVILLGGALVFGLPLPLTALHIIWVNFFTGSLPAISFAFDDNYDNHQIGRTARSSIFNNEVKILTGGIGVLTSVFLFILYYYLVDSGIPFSQVQSLMFACFTLYVLFATFSFRSLHKSILSYPPFANKFLNLSVLFGAGVCFLTLTVPFLRNLFGLGELPLLAYYILPGWLLFNVVLVEFTKWGFRVYKRLKIG